MATLGQIVANGLWFAFDTLDYEKDGIVPKSKLKVLTQNVGVILGIERCVELCITDYLSVKALNFPQFLYFLTHEVLSEVDDGTTPYSLLKQHHSALEDAFWLMGRQTILDRQQPILTPQDSYKLFRIFCMLADRTNKGNLVQVTLNRGEVEEVARNVVVSLGRDWDNIDFEQLVVMMPPFTLTVFITFIESRYLQDTEALAISTALDEVYDIFIDQVLVKGKIHQKLPYVPVWFGRELEVVPWAVQTTKRGKGSVTKKAVDSVGGPLIIEINSQTVVTNITDTPGSRPCRFTISSGSNKMLHFSAPDHRSKSRWLRALDVGQQHSKEGLPYSTLVSAARKADRAIVEERETQERIRRASQADIIEQTQSELVAERLARIQAEEATREEAEGRANEERRVKELTNLRKQLESLLEEETQAKRDEEIVRNLQARVLREEWEKREELEKLQEEQRILLEAEKRKRELFEKQQKEKEKKLKEAEKKLHDLENDRLKLDRELRSAREKIVMSERGKEVIETRMKVKERKPPSRTFSLRPVGGRERGSTPVRSSSFNMHASIHSLEANVNGKGINNNNNDSVKDGKLPLPNNQHFRRSSDDTDGEYSDTQSVNTNQDTNSVSTTHETISVNMHDANTQNTLDIPSGVTHPPSIESIIEDLTHSEEEEVFETETDQVNADKNSVNNSQTIST